MRVLLFAVLLTLSACSTTTLVEIRSHGCDVEEVNGLHLAFCGDRAMANHDQWVEEAPLVMWAMDDALGKWGLPPLTAHTEGALVRLYDFEDGPGNVTGRYLGYAEPETRSISVWMKRGFDTPEFSAFPHELFHLYDDEEFGVSTLARWYELVADKGRHFLVPIIADHVVKHGRNATVTREGYSPETAVDMIFCGGPE